MCGKMYGRISLRHDSEFWILGGEKGGEDAYGC